MKAPASSLSFHQSPSSSISAPNLPLSLLKVLVLVPKARTNCCKDSLHKEKRGQQSSSKPQEFTFIPPAPGSILKPRVPPLQVGEKWDCRGRKQQEGEEKAGS